MKLIGGRSGFKTGRDLILCAVGVFGCLYHLIQSGGEVQLPILMFFGGLAGAPYVLSKDEAKKDE